MHSSPGLLSSWKRFTTFWMSFAYVILVWNQENLLYISANPPQPCSLASTQTLLHRGEPGDEAAQAVVPNRETMRLLRWILELRVSANLILLLSAASKYSRFSSSVRTSTGGSFTWVHRFKEVPAQTTLQGLHNIRSLVKRTDSKKLKTPMISQSTTTVVWSMNITRSLHKQHYCTWLSHTIISNRRISFYSCHPGGQFHSCDHTVNIVAHFWFVFRFCNEHRISLRGCEGVCVSVCVFARYTHVDRRAPTRHHVKISQTLQTCCLFPVNGSSLCTHNPTWSTVTTQSTDRCTVYSLIPYWIGNETTLWVSVQC